MNTEIRILIADDHPLFRRGLRFTIESDPALRVVAEIGDGASALAQLEALRPDIAVLDVDMPAPDGLAVARIVAERGWPTNVVFLTMHKDEAVFHAALDLGVRGFVLKDGLADENITCIKAVAAGQSYFSPGLSVFLARQAGQRNQRAADESGVLAALAELSPVERRVLRLLADGQSSREIAETLVVSVRTVEHQRASIAAKLGVKGAPALLLFAHTHKAKL
ncbi:MAG: response regulator transcription factor [Acidobacteriota bacterium]